VTDIEKLSFLLLFLEIELLQPAYGIKT